VTRGSRLGPRAVSASGSPRLLPSGSASHP